MADLASVLPWGRDESGFVSDLQRGSEAAFDLLITHYQAPVYGLLYSMLGNDSDAADCSQEVFLKAYRGVRAFRRGSSLKTWLYRIAVREALNCRRWRWRHLRQQVSLLSGTRYEPEIYEPEQQSRSAFDRVAAGEVQQLVHRALARVPAVFRSAVILRDLEGLAYEEIAEVMDVSVGTVKSRILRGRRALKEILESWLEDSRARCGADVARPVESALALDLTAVPSAGRSNGWASGGGK